LAGRSLRIELEADSLIVPKIASAAAFRLTLEAGATLASAGLVTFAGSANSACGNNAFTESSANACARSPPATSDDVP